MPSERHNLSFSSHLAGHGVATGREGEAAEARHLLCVCVCVFFALTIAWWTITNCVDVFLVRARKKKVCVWRNCSVH